MNTIYHDLIIEASPNEVFKALSNPEDLENWWPLKCSGEPKVGVVYNFNFTDTYDWYGKVIKSVSGESFYIKMTKSDKDWNPTTFGFDLEARDDGGTYLSFWHKDWADANKEFRLSSFCWAILLQGLKNYLEKGEVIPFEERE